MQYIAYYTGMAVPYAFGLWLLITGIKSCFQDYKSIKRSFGKLFLLTWAGVSLVLLIGGIRVVKVISCISVIALFFGILFWIATLTQKRKTKAKD